VTRCIDKHCADGPPENGQPRPRWAQTGLLCRRCADRLERHLAELPAQAQQLRAVLSGPPRGGRGENRPTKGNPPVPLNLAAHDHLQHLTDTLASWAQLVIDERSLRGPDTPTIESLSRWLLAQIDWLITQPWVDDLADEMRDLTRVADGLTHARPGWHRLPVPCPGCDSLSLGRWDGDDHINCSTCGERWAEQDYPRFVRVVAGDVTVTAPEAAARAGVEPSTFRGWAAAGALLPIGKIDGVSRYAVEDVDRVAAAKRDAAQSA
jgi:hypothetical protein